MYRGQTLFKCTQCGKRFMGPDIELAATVLTAPCKCPQCGSIRTRPSRLVNLFSWTSDFTYRKIWEDMEKRQQEQ
jgi:DNA-directed RNA polymerase subunit RPC12/RpoP